MSEKQTPDTAELRAAAERVADRYMTAAECECLKGPLAGAIIDLLHSLGHQVDDDEATDIIWLNSLQRADGGDLSMLCVRLVDDKFHLAMHGYVSPKPATRGDVRRLLSALGVTTKPAADQ
jgi:hypothetical protein